MKVIISHDVDYLYVSDHYFKDLIIEKLIIRSVFQFINHSITWHTLLHRFNLIFTNKMNNIKDLLEFDLDHKIPSVFFFGMSNGLAYSKRKVVPYIELVTNFGFDVGVHGIEYQSLNGIRREYSMMKNILGQSTFGIRNHYVRFDNNTFERMNEVGYLFDSTYFNKSRTELLNPYKVGNMWEFPLHIMDVYAYRTGNLQEDLKWTYRIVENAADKGIEYFTLLFHDDEFNHDIYPEQFEWYISMISYFEDRGYEFISYRDAIMELEKDG